MALQGFHVRSTGRSGRAILHRVTLTFTGRTRVWHCHRAVRTSSVALQGFQVRSLGRSDRAILHRITLTFTGVWHCHRAVGTSSMALQGSQVRSKSHSASAQALCGLFRLVHRAVQSVCSMCSHVSGEFSSFHRCFASAETTRTIRDGEPRTATSTFTRLCPVGKHDTLFCPCWLSVALCPQKP